VIHAYIGIGSNLGDKRRYCNQAVERIKRLPNSELLKKSNWYMTEPVGVDGQDWYMNGAVSLATETPARDLLNHLLTIEKKMGRVRNRRWDPRTIDLDLLMYGQDIIEEDFLKVPHPLMHLRRFVLVPLVQIAPDLLHPVLGVAVSELLGRLSEDGQHLRSLKE
jgi:2-amino-4-hydroxy-6-hydroxymethyldihydropteridine diphosphokinase